MDTKEEATRLLREAREDLDRAIRYSGLEDWMTVVHYSQLAIEKSAKSLISCREQDKLYCAFSELIREFERDITVLAYDINGIKRVPTWQTLNLLKDAHFVYDRAKVEELFRLILEQIEEHGILYDEREKLFKLKKPERVVFSLGWSSL